MFRSAARILGYQPQESVALVLGAQDGARAVLRSALPRGGGLGAAFAGLPDLGPGARGALLLYTALPWAEALDRFRPGLLAAATRLRAGGLPIPLAAISAGDFWGDVSGGTAPLPQPCTAPGSPRGLRDAARLPRLTQAQRSEFDHALRAAQGRSLLGDCAGPRPIAEIVDDALDGRRVAVLAELVARMAADRTERDRALRRLVWGGCPARPGPDAARIAQGIELLRYAAAAVTTRNDHAVLLTSIAWLHFALGGGSMADEYVAHALSWDPDSEFAQAVAEEVEDGPAAPWQLEALARWREPSPAG